MGADDGNVHLSDIFGLLDPYVVTLREDLAEHAQVSELGVAVVLICQL